MKKLTNKIEIRDIEFADSWSERQERCKQINKLNEVRNLFLHISVTLCLSMCLIQSTLRHYEDYIRGNILFFLIWLVGISFMTFCYWKGFCGLLADVIDVIIILKGHKPIFKKIGDAGAYVSNLIYKYPTSIYLNQYQVEIIVDNKENEKTILQSCKIEYQNIAEPKLDLNQMKVILPYGKENMNIC